MAAQNKPRLSVRATARAAGISASHVSYILSGKRRPSLAVAQRLAAVCGMSLQGLVDLIDAPPCGPTDTAPATG